MKRPKTDKEVAAELILLRDNHRHYFAACEALCEIVDKWLRPMTLSFDEQHRKALNAALAAWRAAKEGAK